MNDIYVHGIGLTAAGMITWVEAAAILRGDRYYDKTELPAYTPRLLSQDEKCRTTELIKLALHVAEQAAENCAISAEKVCAVFASSEGDMHSVDTICGALTKTDRPVSPTEFQNSSQRTGGLLVYRHRQPLGLRQYEQRPGQFFRRLVGSRRYMRRGALHYLVGEL